MDELTDKLSALTGLFKGQTLYKAEANLPALNYEGNNSKRILLVFDTPDSAAEKEILNRMFSRLNTPLSDIALVNKALNGNLSYQQLSKELRPKAFISFGLPPSVFNLNVDAKPYEIVKMGDCQLLFCDDLLTIDKNNNLKKKFWAEFAPFFT